MILSDFSKVPQYASGRVEWQQCFPVLNPVMPPGTGQSNQQKIETEVYREPLKQFLRPFVRNVPRSLCSFYSLKVNTFPLGTRALQDLSPRRNWPPSTCSADSYQALPHSARNANKTKPTNQPTMLVMVPPIRKFSTNLRR